MFRDVAEYFSSIRRVFYIQSLLKTIANIWRIAAKKWRNNSIKCKNVYALSNVSNKNKTLNHAWFHAWYLGFQWSEIDVIFHMLPNTQANFRGYFKQVDIYASVDARNLSPINSKFYFFIFFKQVGILSRSGHEVLKNRGEDLRKSKCKSNNF